MGTEVFALQTAVLHVLLERHPELKNEVLEKAEFYRETFFIPGKEVGPAMSEAVNYLLAAVGATEGGR